MNLFFAGLYEWWGLFRMYSNGLRLHLRGYDITCSEFSGTPWYSIIGIAMLFISGLTYGLQYHFINSPSYNKRSSWWTSALIIVILDFLIALTISSNAKRTGNYCSQLSFNYGDCIGFAFSNALWGILLFALLTTFPWPRRYSSNCRHTTFWKP